MKIVAIDTSHNVSPQKAGVFLQVHSNADLIYTFDYQFYEYSSAKDLRKDLNRYPNEFYSKPAAYYDMVTAILSGAKDCSPDSILIFSPGIDECSRFSNDVTFANYIRHFRKYHPDILELDYSFTGLAPRHPWHLRRTDQDSHREFPLLELFIPEVDTSDDEDEEHDVTVLQSILEEGHLLSGFFNVLKNLFRYDYTVIDD